MKILTCNSNRPLAEAISAYLDLPLTKASVRRFSDMEVFVEIHENVRGEDVFVIQSTSYPANDNLMELLVTLDALKRASARRVTAVIPYYGYARQDRKSAPRTPISAKLVANLITAAGADRVLTLDLHAGQIQGFFDIPTDNLYRRAGAGEGHPGAPSTARIWSSSRPMSAASCAPAHIARRLDADLAIVDKRRERAGVSEVMNIIGDVDGPPLHPGRRHRRQRRHAVQRRRGADGARAPRRSMPMSRMACCRAARWRGSPPRRSRCWSSPTASSRPRRCASSRNIRQLTIAPLMAEAIQRISEERSVSSLFD